MRQPNQASIVVKNLLVLGVILNVYVIQPT